MKEIELSFQKNLRDIGGLPTIDGKKIKEGRLFRSGKLSRVSKNDVEILSSLHLTDIVDFRHENEFIHKPDVLLEGVTYHNFSPMVVKVDEENKKKEDSNLLSFLSTKLNGKEYMKVTYKECVISKEGIECYKNFFKVLTSNENGVYLWHCSQGKDRAGIASYLLERALGVSHTDALNDYLASFKAMESKIKQLKFQARREKIYKSEYFKAIDEVFSVNEEYLNSAIEAIRENYQSIEYYLISILEVDIDKLKKIFLD